MFPKAALRHTELFWVSSLPAGASMESELQKDRGKILLSCLRSSGNRASSFYICNTTSKFNKPRPFSDVKAGLIHINSAYKVVHHLGSQLMEVLHTDDCIVEESLGLKCGALTKEQTRHCYREQHQHCGRGKVIQEIRAHVDCKRTSLVN